MTDNSKSKHIQGHAADIISKVSVGDTATFLGVDDATDIYFGAAYSTLLRLKQAHEITLRMRLALAAGTLCAPPSLIADVEGGPFLLANSIIPQLKRLFAPHFGNLDKFAQENAI